MFSIIKSMFKIPDLRKKMLYTILIILVFRIGAIIPVPYLNFSELHDLAPTQNNFFSYIDAFTGGAFSRVTIFSMSISPYITSSIVIQLLTFSIPALERLAREGFEGQKKLNKITRYFTVALALLQSITFYFLLRGGNSMFRHQIVKYRDGASGLFAAIVIVATFTAGSALVMWLGEKINDKGIGNGISIVLFAGILSRGPVMFGKFYSLCKIGGKQAIIAIAIALTFIMVTIFIIFVTNAERRVPIQYAQRIVGRKVYGGQNSHIPIKVTMAGVMPIIFASSFLSFFSMLKAFIDPDAKIWFGKVLNYLEHGTVLYSMIYFLMIIGFNYFYVSIQYNPIEIANNLRKNGGTVPGIRPGMQTTNYLTKVISRVTFIGALFLGFVAILPMILGVFIRMNISIGGTTTLIVIGVALDTMKHIESMLMMKQYKGFLE